MFSTVSYFVLMNRFGFIGELKFRTQAAVRLTIPATNSIIGLRPQEDVLRKKMSWLYWQLLIADKLVTFLNAKVH